jgi:elongation factor P
MDNSTYEQIEIGDDIISGDQSKFLIENDNVNIQFYEGLVVGIELPDNVTLKVEETEAVVKGQTAASSYKPAILTGGIKTSVPPFISNEDLVVVSTTDSSYVEKAKK